MNSYEKIPDDCPLKATPEQRYDRIYPDKDAADRPYVITIIAALQEGASPYTIAEEHCWDINHEYLNLCINLANAALRDIPCSICPHTCPEKIPHLKLRSIRK